VPDAASRRPVRPLVEFRGASGTTARRTRTVMGFRPTRAAFRRPAGVRSPDLLPTRRSEISPPCAFVLLQRHVPAAPHRNVTPQLLRADGRPVSRCSLSWAFVPYDTVSDRQTRLNRATDPSAAACHVRGLVTPFATSTTDPPGARSAGASMGLTLQGVLLGTSGAPLGVPALLTLPTARPPRGERERNGRLQGLIPATSSCCRQPPEGDQPSIPSWALPLQSLLPIRPGHRL